MQSDDLLLYEFPCNEKIRFYLRFEALVKRFDWYCAQDSAITHQAAIGVLFDLSDVAARSDLRNDLVQELMRERRQLEAERRAEGADGEAIGARITALAAAAQQVSQVVGRSGQNIRDNEWLQLIRNRQQLPGGTCEFDMPLLHFWLSRPVEERRAELEKLAESFVPTYRAVTLILSHLRTNSSVSEAHAENGMLQMSVAGRNWSRARIWMPPESTLIPEVSANKYMLWIRFSRPDERRRLHVVHEPIRFRLGLCAN